MRESLPGIFDLSLPEGPGIPLMMDSPHSGREYPGDFRSLVPVADLRRVEDSYVDRLIDAAPEAGATLLCARFPRSYIDPNRAVCDLDASLLKGRWPAPLNPTEKSRLGHGLVWRTFPPDRPLYADRLSVAAVQHRIETYWRPYHAALEGEMTRLHSRFGAVWHLNCHSMPSTSSPYMPGRGGRRADFVLGDRDGESCERDFTHFVRDRLEAMGYGVRLNDPYRGAELVRAYAAPRHGRHSLQIEINRALYMDERSLEPGAGFDALKRTLTRLVEDIAAYTRHRTDTTRPPAEAAE